MLDELVQTRITTRMKAAFGEAANSEGRPASEILRQLIHEWVERMHPDLLEKVAGGEAVALEAKPAQDTSPSQSIYPVLCWRCRSVVGWRSDLGLQGYCPSCGAFIDLRVR